MVGSGPADPGSNPGGAINALDQKEGCFSKVKARRSHAYADVRYKGG